MITQVNKLIYNTLCKGNDVALPTIGSLVVRRSAPVAKGKSGFAAPQRSVTFTGEQRGVSVVALIAQTAGVENSRAEEIYEQWLESVKGEDKVAIEGVGTIANRTFTADEALLSALNPELGIAVAPKAKGCNRTLVVVLAVLLALALAAVAYLLLKDCKCSQTAEPAQSVEMAPAPEAVPAVEPETLPAPAPAPVVEEGVERMEKGGNYLVWGVFSDKANALRYKKLIESRHSSLNCTIYHHKDDTMYLLAICQCPTRMACLERKWELQEIDGLFDDMWIFTNK
ncbi:MAG: hypothetical protein IJX65_03530 [Alistipes sp.]|nr:hypothetical protein [Alistipes sp.]